MESANTNHRAPHPPHISAVIFDFGEVLCHRAPHEDFAPMARILGLTPERFVERYMQNRLDYDRGDLSAEQYWKGFALETGVTLGPGDIGRLESADLALWRRMDPVLLDWIQNLRSAGVRVGLISNMFIALATELRRSALWLRRFDALTFSSEIRLTKPHPEVYMHNLRQLGVPAEQALFLDDRAENVQGATAIGMHGLIYTNPEKLRRELSGWGFPILPASEDSALSPSYSGAHQTFHGMKD